MDKVKEERGDEWLNAVIDYHTAGGYGKEKGLSGYAGYIDCLCERKRRELRILSKLGIKNLVIEHQLSHEEAVGLAEKIIK